MQIPMAAAGPGLRIDATSLKLHPEKTMQDSRVIEVEGVFVGAAVALPNAQGWRIVAANARVSRLDGTIAATMPEVRRLARLAWQATRVLPPVTPSLAATFQPG
jgi:hypothetical protein